MNVNLIEEMVFHHFVLSKLLAALLNYIPCAPSQPPVQLRSIFNCIPFLGFLRTSEILPLYLSG